MPNCHLHWKCVRLRRTEKTEQPGHWICLFWVVNCWSDPLAAGDDIKQKLEFHHVHLELGALGYIETFLFYWSWVFFPKKPPPRPIFVFENTRVPPLDLKKYFFWNRLKSFFYQSHWIAFGLTIPKWYNTWVSKIFFRNIFGKIFLKIFLKKIFTKNISNTQVLYHFGIVRPNAIQWLW